MGEIERVCGHCGAPVVEAKPCRYCGTIAQIKASRSPTTMLRISMRAPPGGIDRAKVRAAIEAAAAQVMRERS